MKKNILVIDPSIMIHKIVQLAFPEESYEVSISEGYPISCTPGDPVHLVLISADLPDQEDVHDVIAQVKNTYDAPTLLMIPKFHDFDTTLARQAGVDETIEKPFTSDALKEKVAAISAVSQDLDQMESLSAEELESITDDEFMLSEEDLMDIGEDDLADVEIPEDLPIGDEPDTSDLPEQDLPAPPTPDPEKEPEPQPEPDESTAKAVPTPEAETPAGTTVTPEGDVPFDDMDIEEDLDSIDFGDFEDEEQLLPPEMMEGVPGVEAAAEAIAVEPEPAEAEQEAILVEESEAVLEEEDKPEVPEIPVEAPEPETPTDISAPEEPEQEAVKPEETIMDVDATEDQPPAMETAGEAEIVADPAETVLDEDMEAVVEDIPAPQFNLPEEVETSAPVTEEDIDVDFAIEEDPQTLQMGSYDVEQPEEAPESEDSDSDSGDESDSHSEDDFPPEPIDLSFDGGEGEIIPPPSSLRDAPATAGALSDTDIDRIAKRVVELMGTDSVRQIAWEVIPVVAEEVVRSRIRELEGDADD